MKAAVYAGTRNIYIDMVTSVKSLLMNSDVDVVYFLTEDDTFPYDLPERVKTINVRDQSFFRKTGPNMKSNYTYMAMMRATLAHMFPDLDVILSLDQDVFVIKDISDLWNMPLDGCYYAAVKELHRSHNGLLYTNMGVVLYNLEKLRDGKADEVISVLDNRQYTWLEQDVFNYLCQGRIKELPSGYNVNRFTAPTDDRRIIHYAGYKIRETRTFPYYLKYQAVPVSDIK